MATGIHRQPDGGISASNMPKFYNNLPYHRWTNRGLQFTLIVCLFLLGFLHRHSYLNFTMTSSPLVLPGDPGQQISLSLSLSLAIWRSIFHFLLHLLLFVTTTTKIFVATASQEDLHTPD